METFFIILYCVAVVPFIWAIAWCIVMLVVDGKKEKKRTLFHTKN